MKVIDKKLEKLYEQVNHLENPLTPNQVMLLKKVVSKFKSKVKTPIDEESAEDRSPLLSSSLVSSPRSCLPQTLAIPSISPTPAVAQVCKQRATWGKFLRKTSEQMLGMQQTGHKVAADADDRLLVNFNYRSYLTSKRL